MTYCEKYGLKLKTFVKEKEGNELIKVTEASDKTYSSMPFTGENAKQFYEDLINNCVNPSNENISVAPPKIWKIDNTSNIKISPRIECKNFKNTDLLLLAQNNNIKDLQDFFKQKKDCDINVTDEFGWTPLMCASCSGAEDAVKILLEKNADPNKCDKLGNTPLKLASLKNHHSIVRLLQNLNKTDNSIEKVSKKPQLEPNIFCDLCNVNFTAKCHLTSTVHLLNCNYKTSTYYGIPENNRGFQLLLKDGWNKEQGLGPHGTGRKFPIKVTVKKNKHGIGIPNVANSTNHPQKNNLKYNKKNMIFNTVRKNKALEKNFRLEFS